MSRFAFVIAFLFSSAIATAEPIHFDEAVDGDLSDNQRDTLFDFGFGNNVVEGTGQVGGSLTGENDYDSFTFVLGEGTFLSGITLGFDGGLTADSDETVARYILRIIDVDSRTRCTLTPRPNLLGGEGSRAYNSCGGTSDTMDWADLGAGTYWLTHGLVGGSGTTGDSWNYSLTFSVNHSVPEPGTLLLLGSGLLAMGAARRRRKA